MNNIQRFIHKKISNIRQKYRDVRRKPIPSDCQTVHRSNTCDAFEYLGYYECERLAPSSNKGVSIYDVQSPSNQTWEVMLEGFQRAFTPMDLLSDRNGDKIAWIAMQWRGQIPLYEDDHDGFHLPRRLKQTLRQQKCIVTVDRDFQGVINDCASTANESRRNSTWLNPEIRRLMLELHRQGYAHSIEVWMNGKLVGGLYGVSLGGYFTIESQFSFVRDASKIALVHLVARLRLGGYRVLDIVEITSHLVQFGAYELEHDDFLQRMKAAVSSEAKWLANDVSSEIIQKEIEQLSQSTNN